VDLEATKKGYPLVVKRGNGKGFNGKIIHRGIFHCHEYRKVGAKMWTFDCWTSVLSYPGEGKHMNVQGCTQIISFSQAQPQRTTTTHRFVFPKNLPNFHVQYPPSFSHLNQSTMQGCFMEDNKRTSLSAFS